MWTIHRVESRGGDLTIYAHDPEGTRVPPGAVLTAARKVLAAGLGVPGKMRPDEVSPRRLTAAERHREEREADRREETLSALANEAGGRRGDYATAGRAMQAHREAAVFTAIDFPGCGWGADSAIEIHLPLEG